MTPTFENLATSLALGLLVGLQRERSASEVAGIRTFPLITVLGTLCGLLFPVLGASVVVAGFVGVTALIIVANLLRTKTAASGSGATTEAAALLMFVVGVYVPLGSPTVATAIGVGVAALLNAKEYLHGFVAKLGDRDVQAIMRFALMSFIILPLVPNRTFGPFDVLNPYQVWLMVVLVVGMSLGGFLLYKFVQGRTGLFLSGLFGGMISSTATAVSYARRSAASPDLAAPAAFVILVASSVMYARLLTEVVVVAPKHAVEIGTPIVVLGVVAVIVAVLAWRRASISQSGLPEQTNPTEIKGALIFGAIYALVLLASAAAREHLGTSGLFGVAAISGLTDMDAITISCARMADAGRITPTQAWQAVVIAVISNTIFKLGVIVVLGCPALARRISPLVGIKVAAAVGVLWLWE